MNYEFCHQSLNCCETLSESWNGDDALLIWNDLYPCEMMMMMTTTKMSSLFAFHVLCLNYWTRFLDGLMMMNVNCGVCDPLMTMIHHLAWSKTMMNYGGHCCYCDHLYDHHDVVMDLSMKMNYHWALKTLPDPYLELASPQTWVDP
jgi:hypothetical protein